MAPVTPIGRAFCVFYAFVSIPICLVMLGGVGMSITQLFNKLDKKLDKCNNPKAEKITMSRRDCSTKIKCFQYDFVSEGCNEGSKTCI